MNHKFPRFLLFSLLLCGISVRSAQADQNSHSLSTVVQTVLDRNPGLKGVSARIQEAQSGLNEARARNWPSLALQSSITRGDNPVYVFGSLLEQQKFGPQNFAIDSLNRPDYLTNIRNALVVGVPVFAGFQIQSQEKMGRLQLEQTQTRWDRTAQNVSFQTVATYLQVLLNRSLLQAMEERIQSSQAEIASAEKLKARGLVLGSDFYAAQAILGGLETQRVQLEKSRDAAQSRLAILLGKSPADLHLAGALTETPYPMESEEALVAEARQHRHELKEADQEASIAGLAYRQAGRSFWPNVEAFASLETDTEDFSSNPTNRLVGLKSNFPLGDPGYFSRKSKARTQWEEARNYKDTAEEQIRIEVLQTANDYEGAAESISLAKDTFARAQKSLELFRPLYREGRQSIIEVLRAEEGLMRAQAAYLETLFKLHAGHAQLLLATGRLDLNAIADIEHHLEAQP